MRWLLLGFLMTANPLWAQVPRGFAKISAHFQVPSKIMFAIALQESGMRVRNRFLPYPWTLNVAGKAKRFQNYQSACLYLKSAISKGLSTDVGMMQIHYQSHFEKIKKQDPCVLLQPAVNVYLATYIYKQQLIQSRDIWHAVGRYHSPGNKQLQARYRQQVQARYAQL